MAKLTVHTATYNRAYILGKAYESLKNQTCKDFEWIIIDGGSTDGSKELIEQYSQHIIYWISEPDKGIYAKYSVLQ